MGQWFVLVKQVFLLIGVMGLLCGCVGTPVADVDAVREQVDWKTDKALQQFSAEMPELQQLSAPPMFCFWVPWGVARRWRYYTTSAITPIPTWIFIPFAWGWGLVRGRSALWR